MAIIALIWVYFGRIDIVVRAQGVIRPHTQMAMIINAVSGEVKEVFFYDGMQVGQGDILYILHTFHLENEAGTIKNRLNNLENELNALNLYRKSIEAGENLIGEYNDELSTRFEIFYVSLRYIEHTSLNQNLVFSENRRELETELANIHFELEMLRNLEASIIANSNMFEGRGYSLSGINQEIFNIYHNQYLTYRADLTNFYFQNVNITEALEGYTTISYSIEHGLDLFEVDSIYRDLYNEYMMQLNLLRERYLSSKEWYLRDKSLYEAGVISRLVFQESENAYNIARFNIEEYMLSFTIRINNEIRYAQNRLIDSNNQLETFRLDSLVSVGNRILQLETTTHDLSQRITHTSLQQESLFLLNDELGNVTLNRLEEINHTLNQISAIEQEILLLESNYVQLMSQIDDSVVRAQIDGEISIYTEILEGSFLISGVNVLSIIPTRGELLTANIFVSNNDIASIEEGMIVRYDIPALPHRDFGEITGNIIRISADTTTQNGSHGYFLVESLLEDRVYYDSRGNGTMLRVGMYFEARVIVDRQRILFYLLDQLNFMI